MLKFAFEEKVLKGFFPPKSLRIPEVNPTLKVIVPPERWPSPVAVSHDIRHVMVPSVDVGL